MTNTETPIRECPICSSPGGECYRICPNSADYYSPEQERRDADDFEHGGYQAQLAAEHLAEAADCWSEAEDAYYAEMDDLAEMQSRRLDHGDTFGES